MLHNVQLSRIQPRPRRVSYITMKRVYPSAKFIRDFNLHRFIPVDVPLCGCLRSNFTFTFRWLVGTPLSTIAHPHSHQRKMARRNSTFSSICLVKIHQNMIHSLIVFVWIKLWCRMDDLPGPPRSTSEILKSRQHMQDGPLQTQFLNPSFSSRPFVPAIKSANI